MFKRSLGGHLISSLFLVALLSGCGGGSSQQPPPPGSAEFLYLGGSAFDAPFNTTITTYKVDASKGTMTKSAQASLQVNSARLPKPLPFVVRPDGKFLYLTENPASGNVVGIFSIDSNKGRLTAAGMFDPATSCANICPPAVN